MNKYQQALDDICCKLNSTDIECRICKENKLMKCKFDYMESPLLLKELIDKEIPKKPRFESDGYYDGQPVYDTWICPNCNKEIQAGLAYCPHCGAALNPAPVAFANTYDCSASLNVTLAL